MGGKGRTTINQPDPIDPGKAMGEYLFGAGFGNFRGVTDPRLQERLIGAEERFRPRYAALELKDIETFAYGLEGGVDSPAYQKKQKELDALKEARRKSGGRSVNTDQLVRNILGERPDEKIYVGTKFKRLKHNPEFDEYNRKYKQLKESFSGIGTGDLDARIAIAEAELVELEQGGTAGLFDLLEDAGRRSSAMQRESLQAQREADVGALREFAPQVVEAYRAADPYSTMLAEQTQRRAMGQLTLDEERDIQQQARQAAAARGRTGASAEFGEVLGRRAFTDQYVQPAFQMNRALAGDIGMTILGRPSSGLAMGGSVLGQAQAQAAQPIGPQLFDPNMGINMAMQQRSQDMSLLGAQAQADATRAAGRSEMLGQMAMAIGTYGACWVAREVYGIHNPRWLAFRQWMLVQSPSWFRNIYIKYGERFAKFISNKPFIKKLIRKWMDTKIS